MLNKIISFLKYRIVYYVVLLLVILEVVVVVILFLYIYIYIYYTYIKGHILNKTIFITFILTFNFFL